VQPLLQFAVGSEVSQFFFSGRRRHTRVSRDWSSDVCSSDLSKSEQKKIVMAGNLPCLNWYFGRILVSLSSSQGKRELRDLDQNEIGRASCRERRMVRVVARAVKTRFTDASMAPRRNRGMEDG